MPEDFDRLKAQKDRIVREQSAQTAEKIHQLEAEVARLTTRLTDEKAAVVRLLTDHQGFSQFATEKYAKAEAERRELQASVARLTQARDKQLAANQDADFNCINCDEGLTKETWKWFGHDVGPFCDRCFTAAAEAEAGPLHAWPDLNALIALMADIRHCCEEWQADPAVSDDQAIAAEVWARELEAILKPYEVAGPLPAPQEPTT